MKTMIRTCTMLALLMFSAVLTGCSSVAPDPGYEAVLTAKPMFAGHGGVLPEPVKTGLTYVAMTTDATMVNMTPQTTHVAFDDFSSKDNILLDFDTALRWHVTDSVRLVRDFGGEAWFKNSLASQYASLVREAVKGQTMPDMMSNPVVATQVDQQITNAVRDLVKNEGLPVAIDDVTLGRARPNPEVLTQMNETAAQQQRLRTLVAAKNAEDTRKAMEIAKADADVAYRNQMGMDVQAYTALQIAQINADACKAAKQCVWTTLGTTTLVSAK